MLESGLRTAREDVRVAVSLPGVLMCRGSPRTLLRRLPAPGGAWETWCTCADSLMHTRFFSGITARGGVAGLCSGRVFSRLHRFVFPPTVPEGSIFPKSASTFGGGTIFYCHFDRSVVGSHCDFNLHFSNEYVVHLCM